MFEFLFEIEDWLDDITKNILSLRGIEPHLLEIESEQLYYAEKVRIVLLNLDKYRDGATIIKVKAELRNVFSTPENSKHFNFLISEVQNKFAEFWDAGDSFEEFFNNWRSNNVVKTILEAKHENGISFWEAINEGEATIDNESEDASQNLETNKIEDENVVNPYERLIVDIDWKLDEIHCFFKPWSWNRNPYISGSSLESVLSKYYSINNNNPVESVVTTIQSQTDQSREILVRVIQDTYNGLVERIEQIPTTLDTFHYVSYYENESFVDKINSLAQDFGSYFMDEEDKYLLKNEIDKNFRCVNRDGSEFIYIKELDGLFSKIDILQSKAEKLTGKNYFIDKFNTKDSEASLARSIITLLDIVKNCIDMLAISRNEATVVLSKSLLIQERPTQFPSISLQSSEMAVKSISNAKLTWNGTNDSLYDLFAQLSLSTCSPDKPLLGNTIKSLALFLATNVEGMPNAETIERRIGEFRNRLNQPPKRGRIEIHVNKNNL